MQNEKCKRANSFFFSKFYFNDIAGHKVTVASAVEIFLHDRTRLLPPTLGMSQLYLQV